MNSSSTVDLADKSLDDLINLVYQTLEDDTVWDTFFQRCCDAVGSKLIHMVGFDKQSGSLSYSGGVNMPIEGELAHIQKYHRIDPIIDYLLYAPALEWMLDHEHLGEELMNEHPFHQEFLLSYDTKYRHSCKLVDNDDLVLLITLITSPSQGPLPPERLAFMDKLIPHISRVCRLTAQNFIYSTQALVGHTLVNKLRQPVILMSITGEVVHVNESATEMLASNSVVRINEGQLHFPKKYSKAFFNDCAAMECELKSVDDSSNSPSEFKLLQMESQDGGESLYAFYSILLPQRIMGTFGLRPLVILFFYHPNSAPQVDASILSAAFGLTPAECRTAILLAEGLTQKEIAEKLGLKPDTIRKQLQIIYQKTATKQQSELMRLMLHLPSNFDQRPVTKSANLKMQ